jgi:hypothetical protein
MSEPSTCVGCFYAEWSPTTAGEGVCRYLKFHPLDLKLSGALFWLTQSGPRPLALRINRRAKDGVERCAFKSEEAKP